MHVAVPMSLLLAACTTTDPGGGPGPPPLTGEPCPTVHAVAALRPTSFSAPSRLARFDERLRPCRGSSVEGSIGAVSGLPDGSELLGVDGVLVRVRDRDEVWRHEPTIRADAASSMALLEVDGLELVAVLWARDGGGATGLEVLRIADGSLERTYDVSSSIRAIATASSGQGDRLSLLHQYDGVSEVRVVLEAESLGGVGEREIAAPRSIGALQTLDARPGHLAASSTEGVLRWSDETPSFLGPVTCRWPRLSDSVIPSSCREMAGAAMHPDEPDRVLSICEAPEGLPGDGRGGALVQIGPRGDCEVILFPDQITDAILADVDWAGI